MFIGYDFASDENSLNPHMLNIGDIEEVELLNGIFDELMMKLKSIYPYDEERESWKDPTYLIARFKGDLNGGNVDFLDLTVQDIVIKRRKIDNLGDWTRVASTPYDKDKIGGYEFFDKFNESHQEYEYAFVPTMPQGIEGDYITESVWSEFEDIFISEKDKHFKMAYNMSQGDHQVVTKNSTFEPIGSKYPIIVSNGSTNYEQGSLNALVMDEKNIEDLNPREQTEYRKELTQFLTNNKPKVLKKQNGELYVIRVVESPTVEYLDSVQGTLANISFSYVEVADDSENSLINNGLLSKGVVK